MRKLLYLPLLWLICSCATTPNSPLEGAWVWVGSANDELIHIYTFDNYVGVGIEMGKDRAKKLFGRLEYASDSTAVISFTDGLKANLLFKSNGSENNSSYYIKLVDTEGYWDRVSEPEDYKGNKKEKAFRAAIYAETYN